VNIFPKSSELLLIERTLSVVAAAAVVVVVVNYDDEAICCGSRKIAESLKGTLRSTMKVSE
jgi:hypothetical protein